MLYRALSSKAFVICLPGMTSFMRIPYFSRIIYTFNIVNCLSFIILP